MSESISQKPLSTREQMVIWILLLAIKILKPTDYSHEYTKELDEVKRLLGETTNEKE